MANAFRTAALFGLMTTLGCAPIEAGVSEEAIVGGALETGYPSVYYMYRTDGFACTASLIAPRVVLTARHCVVDSSMSAPAPASIFRLMVGAMSRSPSRTYNVTSVHIIPGSTSAIGDGASADVALLVLTEDAAEMPMTIARANPTTIVGQAITAIGYGQTPSGSSGVKMRVSSTVDHIESGGIFVPPTVCPGDSGGPIIGADGQIYGVASYIYSTGGGSPRCGTAPGVYNEIYRHLAWIDGIAGTSTPMCVPHAETCNGMDDDCNGVVDEPCVQLGQACTATSMCAGGGTCAMTPAGRLCAVTCDGVRPTLGCAAGFYCASNPSECNGYCVPGTIGTGVGGSACTADTACASGVCRDGQCSDPCRADAADCEGGGVCTASAAGTCGVCRAASGSSRGLGEPCEANAECRSGLCAPSGECAAPCNEGSCAAGQLCRDGICIVDRTQGIGGPCTDGTDCSTTLCASQNGRTFCTGECTSAAMCPTGFGCQSAGSVSVCVPMLGTDGESCNEAGDCLSTLCASYGSSAGFCTRFCSAESRCGSGFDCTMIESGERICTPRRTSRGRPSSCAITQGRQGGSALGFLTLLALVALTRRARVRTFAG